MQDPAADEWPALELASWAETYATLHRWTQIVGKTALALAPPLNHWWHTALQIGPCGLTTLPMRSGRGAFRGAFTVAFDFVAHRLEVRTSAGVERVLPLEPRSVAAFHAEYLAVLRALGIAVTITPRPSEIADAIPFPEDTTHASYDPDAVGRWWRIVAGTARVLQEFRGGYVGKASPVHFFWGSFDLAESRFTGRAAPPRAGADRITREAYSHELMSVGFWPGSGAVAEPAFYAYASPEPAGFADAKAGPASASYNKAVGEFILPYAAVRTAPDPGRQVREFAEAAYLAAATCGGWDRAALERTGPATSR
jgi:hypothetical protein